MGDLSLLWYCYTTVITYIVLWVCVVKLWVEAICIGTRLHLNFNKLLCRVLRPPGGGSSNLFGGYEDDTASRRPNKMASTIFAPPEEPQEAPKRSNPPGMNISLGVQFR